MRIPKLNITTKDLSLMALGISAVLVCSIFRQALLQYILIGMFFGLLSKGARWKYWGAHLLINAFVGFRSILNTDIMTVMVVGMSTLMESVNEPPVLYNISFVNGTMVTNTTNVVVSALVDLGNTPALKNPIITNILIIILGIIAGVLTIFSIVIGICYIIMLLPIFGHMISMLCIFHRTELQSIVVMIMGGDISVEAVGLLTPYLIQGVAIEMLLASAIFPLISYRILKRVGFYSRISNITI